MNNATNRIVIASVDANIKWSDIEITATSNATWQVQDANQKGLANIGTTTTITSYVAVGESILVMDATGIVIVALKYLPTNHFLGYWIINL